MSFIRRSICYCIGFVMSCLFMWINTRLGHGAESRGMLLTMLFAPSVIYGFMIYNIYFKTPLYRERERGMIFSKEGFLHFGLSFLLLLLFD